MSLNIVEMSDVIQFIDKIEDKKIHDLLHKMQFEYASYTDIGTVEDCKNYKLLCSIPMTQVNTFIQLSNNALLDEIHALQKENKMLKLEKENEELKSKYKRKDKT